MTTRPRAISSMRKLVERLRDDLNGGGKDFVLLYAYNGTGKTRLSMEFKNAGKRQSDTNRDTLYFNAYTEDLFYWDNDLTNDTERVLRFNGDSQFFNGLRKFALEDKIFAYLGRYADLDFKIDDQNNTVTFSREVEERNTTKIVEHIKVSRGEENLFIWCVFLAFCELAIDGAEAYSWVKYLYIDDPISSLDDNNAIAVASDLAQLLKRSHGQLKTVISSHHGLFFNVICNELKKTKHNRYFLHRCQQSNKYTLRSTEDTPFFHHVAILSELQDAAKSGKLYTHHFNALRSILEKTASFFGFDDFSACIKGIDDDVLYARALNLLSHGKYSVYEPKEMGEDNKKLFINILNAFLTRYQFSLPEMLNETTTQVNRS